MCVQKCKKDIRLSWNPVTTTAQAETLQHRLERAAAGMGLHVNADKTEHMCFNQRGDISTLNEWTSSPT